MTSLPLPTVDHRVTCFKVVLLNIPAVSPSRHSRVHKDLSVLPLWSRVLSNSVVARGGVRETMWSRRHFLRSLWFGLSTPSGFLRTSSCSPPGQERSLETLKTPVTLGVCPEVLTSAEK